MTGHRAAVDVSWQDRAACARREPGFMFPTDSHGVAAAKKVCAFCPVRTACLRYALAHRIDHGVWGGKSERERRKQRKGAA